MPSLEVGKTYVGIEHGSKGSKPLIWLWNHCVGADGSKIGLNLGSKDGLPLFHFGWNCTGATPVQGRIYLGIEHGSKDSKPLVWIPCCLSPSPPPPPPPPTLYSLYCCDNVSQQINLPSTIYGTTKYGTFPLNRIPIHIPGSGGGEIRHGWYSQCLAHSEACYYYTVSGGNQIQSHFPIKYRLVFMQVGATCLAGAWIGLSGNVTTDNQHGQCPCHDLGAFSAAPSGSNCPTFIEDQSDPNYGLTTSDPAVYANWTYASGSCAGRTWEFSAPQVGQLICSQEQLFLPGDSLIIHET